MQKLKVAWLASQSSSITGESSDNVGPEPAQRLEDPADTVLRFLGSKTATVLVRTSDYQMAIKGEAIKKAIFVPYHEGKRAMSWRDKLRPWFRLTEKSLIQTARSTARPRHVLGRLALPPKPSKVPGDGSNDQLSATFGHILHDKKQLNQGRGRRLLTPIKPHPAALASITPQNQAVQRQNAIVLHFTRSQSEAAKFPNTYMPPIRLALPVDTGVDFSSFTIPPESTLHCVFPWYENDVLMPDERVDVRVSQSRLLKLDTADIETQQPSLHKFLAASEFNMLEGRLKTPPSASFEVPQSWLRAAQKKSKKADSDKTVTLMYQFAGLEVHQSVEMEFKGHTLRYNSIEAGHHGGKRQELSLIAGPPDGQSKDLDDEQRQSFLKLAGETAMGRQFSWTEGHQNMSAAGTHQIAPRDESMDNFAMESEEQHIDDLKGNVAPETLETEAEDAFSNDGTAPGSSNSSMRAQVDALLDQYKTTFTEAENEQQPEVEEEDSTTVIEQEPPQTESQGTLEDHSYPDVEKAAPSSVLEDLSDDDAKPFSTDESSASTRNAEEDDMDDPGKTAEEDSDASKGNSS
jgi:hypothetical protein